MSRLWIEWILAVIAFGVLLTEVHMLLSYGPLFFVVVALTLFCAIFIAVFRVSTLARCLFCIAVRVGVGPSIS